MCKNIMIADDSMFMRNLLKGYLSVGDYQVVAEASDGCEAVFLYKKYSPDVLLLDLTMPCKEGMTVLKEVIEFNPKANVVICSAMGQQRLIMDALTIGAKDFIVKPNFHVLVPILNNLFH
ncbi:response regulator [Niallia nealsonii]|uniref:Two-component system response regulator n=1 Tax=Niallia nealsonii TaxID=115979 RepID=A0A2N0Z0T0_9BACI|nr:response regulator [Niallia nealsonii]PKG23126.1 two-component system response regulator [Niallia nealsonii]